MTVRRVRWFLAIVSVAIEVGSFIAWRLWLRREASIRPIKARAAQA